MKMTDADHPPPPIIVIVAVWRADRPSPIILPDRRADPVLPPIFPSDIENVTPKLQNALLQAWQP